MITSDPRHAAANDKIWTKLVNCRNKKKTYNAETARMLVAVILKK